MRIANIVSAIVGMLVSGGAFAYTYTFKKFKNVPVGPEFFPRMLALGMFICCVVLLLSNLRQTEKNKGAAPTLSLKNKGVQKALLSIVLILVYALMWEFTGFLVITPFALFAMIFILGKRNYKMMIFVSIAATIVIFLIFKMLLGIEMPLGFVENLL
ncbi:MAG: tripartite tricarboxylate transporter TctB family protein [Treponema sp.]|nr:tripartite tricarboxylate transporter TctB family protein [Treponema sp.]